jgi:hypothetical protein
MVVEKSGVAADRKVYHHAIQYGKAIGSCAIRLVCFAVNVVTHINCLGWRLLLSRGRCEPTTRDQSFKIYSINSATSNPMQSGEPCSTDQTAINVWQEIVLYHVKRVSPYLITRITGVCYRLNVTIVKHFSLTTSFALMMSSIGPMQYSRNDIRFSSRGLHVFHNSFDGNHEMLVHCQTRS